MKCFPEKFFPREEINGRNLCPTYLYRWTLLRLGEYAVYLHHFVAEDWSKDKHDHPKRFISIGLKGSYCEETPEGEKWFHAPWLRSFPASHIHRLRLDGGSCWTLVIVLRTVREWGFWPAHGWMRWKEYLKSEHAEKGKSC